MKSWTAETASSLARSVGLTGSIRGVGGSLPVSGRDDGLDLGQNIAGVVRQLRVRDGFILFAGFVLMQGVAAVAMAVVYGLIAGFVGAVRHGGVMSHARHDTLPPIFFAGLTFATYLASALWCVWYARRRTGMETARALMARIGYLPVERGYFWQAGGIALFSLAFICVTQIIFPVPRGHPSAIASTFEHAGMASMILLTLFSITIAPLVEEFVFRGAAFDALRSAMRPGVAAAIVTVVFVLIHAPEKWGYPPGFLMVGVLAVGAIWLRMKSGSVWPPTLLHALYNVAVILSSVVTTSVIGVHFS